MDLWYTIQDRGRVRLSHRNHSFKGTEMRRRTEYRTQDTGHQRKHARHGIRTTVFCILCSVFFVLPAAAEKASMTNFSKGEVTPRIFGRTETQAFYGGVRLLENMFVWPHGPVEKRRGTYFVATARAEIVTQSIGDPAYPTLQVADGTFATAQADPNLTQGSAISDVNDLQNMNLDLTGNYYLTGDIDASDTVNWNGGSGFVPIGTHVEDTNDEFHGTFDGNGFTITGLYMDEPVAVSVGLFGAINYKVTIYDVTLEDLTVKGERDVGGLVGRISKFDGQNPPFQGPKIINCHITGASLVEGTSGGGGRNIHVGGMIGLDAAPWFPTQFGVMSVFDCTTNATVTATGMQYVGGFVGRSHSSDFANSRATGDVGPGSVGVGGFMGFSAGADCNDCAATGDVTATGKAGGFFGDLETFTEVYRCSARGNVTSSSAFAGAGGFSNTAEGSIFVDCYAWGNATSGADATSGGFIADTGINFAQQTFTNCYAIGTPSGLADYEGGFTGFTDAAAVVNVTSSFWDTDVGFAVDGTNDIAIDTVGHITEWMQTQSNFESAGWDFDTIWEMSGFTSSVSVPIDTAPVRLFSFAAVVGAGRVIEAGDQYFTFFKDVE